MSDRTKSCLSVFGFILALVMPLVALATGWIG